MDPMGLNWWALAAQLANFALLALWITLSVVALMRLRLADVPATARAIWAALILLVPVLGAAAFLVAGPSRAA